MQFIEILKANSGLPWHCLGGVVIVILAYLKNRFWPNKKWDYKHFAVVFTLVFAILWEVFEYFLGLAPYLNDFGLFFIDGFQDIMGAVACAAFTVIILKWLGK